MRSRELAALTRFGLGPSPGLIDRVARDPRRYVAEQVFVPGAATIDDPTLRTLEDGRRLFVEIQAPLKSLNRALRQRDATPALLEAREAAFQRRRAAIRETLETEIGARFNKSVSTPTPFVERLVLFFANHFSIDVRRIGGARFLSGAYERDAIRAHTQGTFADMLVAAITHPAMLAYLENTQSAGPNSRRGRRHGATVNENLAREILELHTLGAQGGYTQADINQLALVLTGWTGGFFTRPVGHFEPRWHEPGPKTVLGTTYADDGRGQLEAVLRDLAVHPSTARFVTGKLARHFVGDDAPEALRDRLADVFLTTGGDLREVALALAEHDLAWAPPPAKAVPPYDFMAAAARALEVEHIQPRAVINAAKSLAHPIWMAPSPAGWPDDDGAFLGGDAMLERVDFAKVIVRRKDREGLLGDARKRARSLFGPALDPFVAEAVDRAEDRRQAAVLLLMSPPFHRR